MNSTRAAFAGLSAAAIAVTALLVPADAGATTLAPSVRTVGHADSGRTITLVKGRTLRIDLRTVVDGGYHWVRTHKPNKAKVEIVKRTVRPYHHKPGTVGFPYHTIYTLKAVGTGTTRITLVERQGTSKADPAAHFTLRMHVVKASD